MNNIKTQNPVSKLNAQFAESVKLEAQIRKNLKGFGHES
jgi:hypothetical protein